MHAYSWNRVKTERVFGGWREELGAFRVSFVGIKPERNPQQAARCFCNISYECGRMETVSKRAENLAVLCLGQRRNKKRESKNF
jgi:hypothetical protein